MHIIDFMPGTWNMAEMRKQEKGFQSKQSCPSKHGLRLMPFAEGELWSCTERDPFSSSSIASRVGCTFQLMVQEK